MRILFLTSRFPGPLLRGDQLRAYQQIRFLSARHRITLIALDSAPPDPARFAALDACCERIVLVRRHHAAMALRAVGALAGNLPLQVAMYDAAELRAEVAAALAGERFDVAHVQLGRLGPFVPRVRPLPVVLDLIDSLAVNMRRRAELDRGPMGWIARLEAARLDRYERTLCASVEAAAVSARQDREAIGNQTHVYVVPNGVDTDLFSFAEPAARPARVVFVGNLGYFPNVDAADWFARQVMPLVAAARPGTTLSLVGARPARAVRLLARTSPHVTLVGPVPEVRSHLEAAAVAVAPLRAGSGQQLKILEAMAAGTPVVATTTAAAGLEAVAGEHLLVADDPATFSAHVVRLLADAPLRVAMARSARRLVEERYSWERSARDLEALWCAAAGRTP